MAIKAVPATRRTPRQRPAHPSPVERHNAPVVLLVTVATLGRRPILADRSVQEGLLQAWQRAERWVVGYYMGMPEHIHIFCSPGAWERDTVTSWCRYWKRLAGQASPRLQGAFIWGCWDTQMRDQEHYRRKLEYVALNPVRRGLVQASDEWPFQGHLHELRW